MRALNTSKPARAAVEPELDRERGPPLGVLQQRPALEGERAGRPRSGPYDRRGGMVWSEIWLFFGTIFRIYWAIRKFLQGSAMID